MRPEFEEWRYLPYGRVRHLMYGSGNVLAHCGAQAFPAIEWRGTGSQQEYEQCASLPKCKVCLRQVARR